MIILESPPGPEVHDFTRTVWESLPEAVKAADVDAGFQLLGYLSTVLDQAGEFVDAATEIDYVAPDEGGVPGETSTLVDPLVAPREWLPWLAQAVGVRLPGGLSLQEQRDAVRYASTGWQSGTKQAIADAARSALTGGKYVRIIDHRTTEGPGGEWDVLVFTRATQTPDVDAVLAAVVAKGAKPAGVVLHHLSYSATWAQVEAAYPTWAARKGLTWTQIEETGAPLS